MDLRQLEQVWLTAETIADEAKHEAMRASEELVRRRMARGEEAPEITVLVSTAERARARQEEAERTASAAFDRLWQANEQRQGQVHA